jgi:hypothetical protein
LDEAHWTPARADSIRSRPAEIHFNTTLLTEICGLALSRRAESCLSRYGAALGCRFAT